MKKGKSLIILIIFALLVLTCENAHAVWKNNLRDLFVKNSIVFYSINIRSFGAVDLNNDGIIDKDFGDVSGTFLNAAKRLPELKEIGVNTIYLLPITKTGKLKAIGTAGSLYAIDAFDKLNPQLDDKTDSRTVDEEAKYFIQKAHELGFYVIVDLPSCGSYDMSLEKSYLFKKDKNGQSVVPSDWTDVRLFKTKDDKNKLNEDLINEYKGFVDLMQSLGIDGIRADVAAIKPHGFWEAIINHARFKDSQFLFLAEASTAWDNPVKGHCDYLTVEELLKEGFDGYYGEYMNFKEFKKPQEFISKIKAEHKLLKKFDYKKSTMASFATHDQISPAIDGKSEYSKTIIWLGATLKTNQYFLDGFPTGDDFIYDYENKKAPNSTTDDDYYFVHKGKFDIFNFSPKPEGNLSDIKTDMVEMAKFNSWAGEILEYGNFKILKTDNNNILAYSRNYNKDSVIVVSNFDKEKPQTTWVKIPKFKKDTFYIPVKSTTLPTVKNGKMHFELKPFETQVFVISKDKR